MKNNRKIEVGQIREATCEGHFGEKYVIVKYCRAPVSQSDLVHIMWIGKEDNGLCEIWPKDYCDYDIVVM